MTTDIQPYYSVSNKGFKYCMSVLCLEYDVKCRLKYELNSDQFLSLTFDCWILNAQHPYIGITTHYIDNNYDLQTYWLTCTTLRCGSYSIQYTRLYWI